MMGRTRRWLKGLFGMNNKETSNSCFPDRGNKKASTFCHPLRRANSTGLISSNPTTTPPNISPAEAAWLRMVSHLYGDDKEKNKQAMAVAVATAAAAEAATEAAKAAVELVRLTSLGRGKMLNCSREVLAAITIQTIFRGFLARKALKALKALVKVQALVRGVLVRKQTYATLHCMEALIRAQQIVLALKARSDILKNHHQNHCPTQFQPRKSPEKFENSRKVIKVASRNKRIYAPFDSNVTKIDQCIKGFEVDSKKTTASRSRRIKKSMNGLFNVDEAYCHATSSPPPRRRNPEWEGRSFRESDQWRGYTIMRRENKYSTAQISPVYVNSCGPNAPINQAKSECGDVYFRNENENHPNYMVNTQSFNSKARSQSVPKRRGDEFSWSKRRLSLNDLIMESKTCQNGARMKTSCAEAQGNINFKNNVIAKIGKSSNSDD